MKYKNSSEEKDIFFDNCASSWWIC